ncbi:hypothetical protein ACFLV9_00220 [Chloroflexota bacterium]
MRQTLNYNIHNLLKFQVVRDEKRALAWDLNFPFSYFEVEKVNDPDIVLNIGKFTPSNHDCYLIEHRYYVKDNYLYCKDIRNRTKWEVEISGFEQGKTVVNFNAATFGFADILIPDFLPQNLLLRPLIEYKLAERNYFLIHSAAVSRNGQAYLLEGRAGAYKTTLCMDLIRKSGFSFMGDDRIIIHDGHVLSFPLHYTTFTFKARNLPTENFRSLWDKIHLLKYLRENLNNTNGDNKVTECSTLKAVFSMVKTNKQYVIKRNSNLKKVVARLPVSMQMEMVHSPTMLGMNFGCYFSYMMAYSFVFPKSKIALYWHKMEDKLLRELENIPLYEIEVPRNYSQETFAEISQFMGMNK